MSLTQSLNNALSGLAVTQAALSITANNIANANTPGYSRQIVDQSAMILGNQGNGAWIENVSRKIDVYLERSIHREINNVGRAEEISDYFERIQILLGEPGSDNSVDEYIQSFFNSLQSLAETPDSASFKTSAIDTAEVLARELSGLAEGLEDLRYQADQDMAELVSSINADLAHLESINMAIDRAAALNLPTPSLLDERDNTIEALSKKLDISVYYNESGSVNVFTAGGVGLVEELANEVSYVPASGIQDFIENSAMNPLQVHTLDEDGNITLTTNIISAGIEHGVVSKLSGGQMEGLRTLRDELIPDILAQLDELAAQMRDAVNAIHNDGSGFPPATELNGTRLVRANEFYDWTGQATIAILNPDGSPVESPYANESHTGLRPLTLDLGALDAGKGEGVLSAQAIIDEINNHFNAPPVKATMGNLNNIQLASNTSFLPSGSPTQFSFDLDLENIADFGSEIWVTNVTITDDSSTQIASQTGGEVTNTAPALGVSSFDFTAGSTSIVVNTASNHGLEVGDYVFLENPGGGPYGGAIGAAQLTGMVQVTAVNDGDSFEFTIATAATATAAGVAPASTINALPKYHDLEAGEKSRAKPNGTFTADLSTNAASEYYDITLTLYSRDLDTNANPAITNGTVTYRIYNNTTHMMNDRYDVLSTTGAASREFPSTPHQYIIARLVDENGVELPSTNGNYGGQSGYLQLIANPINGATYAIAIDEGTSAQQGQITLKNPSIEGTGRGLSHYFELNNFFVSNDPNETGDTTTGSAYYMAVEQRLLDDPSLISTGQLELSNQSANPDDPRVYTYERYIGNNSVIQRLAKAGFQQVSFSAAGGLPNSKQTFSGYTGEMLGFIATKTVVFSAAHDDVNALLEGLISRSDAISGVNLDEELANTQLYQAAYNASARVISVTNELFDSLLQAFN